MIRLCRQDQIVSVYRGDEYEGFIELYDNPYHMRNCYIDGDLAGLHLTDSGELFAMLADMVGRPLQAVVNSDDAEKARFLTSGGFVCRRKCYEREVSPADLTDEGREAVGRRGQETRLRHTHAGEQAYDRCCEMMYEYYIKTHQAINPWTADFASFCDKLPRDAAYERKQDGIENLAFVEENEIAYVYGSDKSGFRVFAAGLIGWLFTQYDTICFESDDGDPAAMTLKSMFIQQDGISVDTWIYEKPADSCSLTP